MKTPITVLVVGCGKMGSAHARAYQNLEEFAVIGVVSRGVESRARLAAALDGVPDFSDFQVALAATKPAAVSINTYPDTHFAFAMAALEAGAHVFIEKPIAETPDQARKIIDLASKVERKVVVGYILRHHPSWAQFVEISQTLGKPLVMRMNLNQQSNAAEWRVHKNLMKSMSPIVDCGVHYVDIMCQMTRAAPVRVHAIGARLSEELVPNMYNYGQLQVVFDDGSVGWYEAGWGPMVSETAYFVKDVFGPLGSVSIVEPQPESSGHRSADVEAHTKTDMLRVHRASLSDTGSYALEDSMIRTESEPGHDELCEREQRFFLRAITEDLDLSSHLEDAAVSLDIVLAADRSVRTGRAIELPRRESDTDRRTSV